MKKLILAFVMMAGLTSAQEFGYFSRADFNSEWSPTNVVLNAGDQLIFLATDHYSFGINLTDGDGNLHYIPSDYIILTSGSSAYPVESRILVGPAIISPNHPYGSYLAYKIIRAETVGVSTTPLNIISLPDDNNGDVEILIESSTDLLSWTPVYSGSAGTSNNAAFIRTRLIQN